MKKWSAAFGRGPYLVIGVWLLQSRFLWCPDGLMVFGSAGAGDYYHFSDGSVFVIYFVLATLRLSMKTNAF